MTARLAAYLSPPDPRPDGALLAAFLAGRDHAAFAELVRRHAGLVWAACRRALPDPADAEDVFQATFLVLVRRAPGLTGAATVGPWLYKVAGWAARNLRRKNARRAARRRGLPADVPDPRATPGHAAEPPFDLDAALLALPDRHRAAIVLCCVQGLTHRQAADRLGCAEGTVSSRVSRGLAALRAKLGDPLPLLLAAAAGSVPAGLSAGTARAAAAFHTTSLTAAATPAVARLTEGALRMFWVKKAVAAGVAGAMLVLAGVGVGVGVRQAPQAAAADPPKAAAEKPADPPADDATLQKRLRELEAQQQQLAAREQELAAQRERLAAEVARMTAALAARDARSGRRLVVTVGGRTSLPPVAVTEVADGKPVWTVGFSGVSWDKPDWTPLGDYLARAKADPTGPRAVTVEAEPAAPAEHVSAVIKACRATGFEPVLADGGPVRLGIKMTREKADPGVRAEPEVDARTQAAPVAVPVGGTVRLSLSPGATIVDVGFAPKDVVEDVSGPADRGDRRIVGRKPGVAVLTLTDDQKRKYQVTVTVTDKPADDPLRIPPVGR